MMELTLTNILLVSGAVLVGVFILKFLVRFLFQIILTLFLMGVINRLMPVLMPWFVPFLAGLLAHFFQVGPKVAWAEPVIQWVAPFLLASFISSLFWNFVRGFRRRL